MNRRRASVLSMLVAPLLLMMGLTVSSAQASATNIVNIPSELDACKGVAQNVGLTKHEGGFNAGVYNTFGKSYPVILVHGYGGKNAGQWGDLDQSTDLAARIDGVSNAVVATEFQYDSTHDLDTSIDWSTGTLHQGVETHFQPLANTIDCIAQISAQNDGPGKVIVVGYSEGSALTHGAATRISADTKRAIGDEIGQVVSVADGRFAYGLSVFSAPNFPSNVVVHAIAGDQRYIVFGALIDTRSDGVVRVKDALAQYSPASVAGGGSKEIRCTVTSGVIPCAHANLLRNSEETQWDIVGAITAFVNAHCTGTEPSSSPMNAAPAVDPTPPPTPTNTSTPGGPPTVDPTGQPTPPPTSPSGGCVA